MMKAYYAHCQALYDTKQEARDLETILALGFKAVNPNDPELDAYFDEEQMDREQRMQYFKRYADICDLVIFRGLPTGDIPSGVALELKWFKERNKIMLELPSSVLRRELSLEETREYIREVGKR